MSFLVAGLVVVLAGAFVLRIFVLDNSPKAGPAVAVSSPPSVPTSSAPASSSPSAAPSPAPARGKLVIHGAGDTNLDPHSISNFQRYGYAWAWTGLNGLFKSDDLTLVNLECAVSNLGSAVPKEFNFRGDPAALPAMRKAGVEVANMANNHSYDYGPTALVDMRANLIENHIAPVGAGKDEKEALKPAPFEIKGWKIAVVGFDEVVDPWPTAVATADKPGTAAGHDLDAMVEAVTEAKKHADFVVVAIHWGVELDTQPRGGDVALAHRLVNAGAKVIFGGHSHRLQPLEIYGGAAIFYSLGNFVWPSLSTAGATTAVAEVRISPTGKLRASMLPAFIEASGHPVLRS
jgi:poly-gamma-glutamate capsule biosynthesis protein CapA/YwtB (metallophosphatase superfamily)